MNFSRYILIMLGLLIAVTASAQGFFKLFPPNTSAARDVVEAADGGYLAVGEITQDSLLFIQKTTIDGQAEWSNHLAFNRSRAIAVCLAADGGYGILVENYHEGVQRKNAVLKLSATGTVSWTRILPNQFFLANGLRDIVGLPDGSFLLAGDAYNAAIQNVNRLVKLTPDGQILWDKTAGINFWNVTQAVQLPDGNLAIGGGRNNGDFSLAKIDPEGQLLWEKTYVKPLYQKAAGLTYTTDGGFALLGSSQHPSLGRIEVFLIKTDAAGNEQWAQSIYPYPWPASVPVLFSLSGLTQDATGHYYIPLSPLSQPLELLKLDPSGNAIWKKDLELSGITWSSIESAGNYLLLAGDNESNAFLLKLDSEGEYLNHRISGSVFQDLNADCTFNSGENGLAHFIVEARETSGLTFYRNTNPDGSYDLRVTAGQYTLTARPAFGPAGFYALCDTLPVDLSGPAQTVSGQNLGIEALATCPLMEVEISEGLLRRCTTVRYQVLYCNYGNQTAQNVSVVLDADPLLEYLGSNATLGNQTGQSLTFLLPDVAPTDCGSFYVDFTVKCEAELGEVICVDAHIFPDSSCLPPSNNWDGSEVEVSGECSGNTIQFTIKNTGSAPMSQTLDYVIIEDHIMYMQGAVQLDAAQDTVIEIDNPGGDGYAGQLFASENNPTYIKIPAATVDNCLTGASSTLPLELNTDPNSPAFATTCDQVIGSFDPNDKRAYPAGWGDKNLLERNEDIDYTIRFQNTGNDTAFLVVIRDTLPVSTLDPATVLPLAASHSYLWELSDRGILKATFPNILLPDSSTNEPASHGFITFRVAQRPDLPDGTRIENSAAIYFDFNEPIITNTYFHTIGRPLVSIVHTPGNPALLDLVVMPHPLLESATIRLKNYEPKSAVHFQLMDTYGRPAQDRYFIGAEFLFHAGELPSGLYYFTMKENGQLLRSGKLLIQKP